MASTTTESSILRKEEDEEKHESEPLVEEEDTGAQFVPLVKLSEVAVATGEENEEILLELKAKLYRFDKEGNQWKERGVGVVKLLKHKESGKVRLVMRQNKTLKICANHLVTPEMSVKEHQGNEKSCVWLANDFADGELKDETFCIRFPSIENCKTFRDKIEEITRSNPLVDGESDEANVVVQLIEKLTVEETSTEKTTGDHSQVNEESNEANVTAQPVEKSSVEESKAEGDISTQEKRDDTEKQAKSGDEN